jgi:hypothetical protein
VKTSKVNLTGSMHLLFLKKNKIEIKSSSIKNNY